MNMLHGYTMRGLREARVIGVRLSNTFQQVGVWKSHGVQVKHARIKSRERERVYDIGMGHRRNSAYEQEREQDRCSAQTFFSKEEVARGMDLRSNYAVLMKNAQIKP